MSFSRLEIFAKLFYVSSRGKINYILFNLKKKKKKKMWHLQPQSICKKGENKERNDF